MPYGYNPRTPPAPMSAAFELPQIGMMRGQRDLDIANQLMSAQYAQDSGPWGVLAQVAQVWKGKKLAKRGEESIAEALQRQFEEDAKAQAAARERAAKEEAEEYQRNLGRRRAEAGDPLLNPQKPREPMRVGNQLVMVDDNGQARVIHETPRAPQQGPQTPEAIREFQYFSSLPPEQQQAYLQMRGRSGQQGPAAPSGYRQTEDGGLTFIPGGPADPATRPLPAEQAARKALSDVFLQQAPDIIKAAEGGALTGIIDQAFTHAGFANPISGVDAGEMNRQIKSGVDALRRNLTGAGMSASESEEYVSRYQPSRTDTAAKLASKLRQLETELKAYSQVLQGKSSSGGGAPTAPGGAPNYLDTLRKYENGF